MTCLAMYEKKAITKCNMFYNVRQKMLLQSAQYITIYYKKKHTHTQNVKRMAEK